MPVRKRILKPLAIFMVVCMSFSLAGMTSAESERKVSDRKTEIIFEDELCREKAEILTAVINGEEVENPRNLLCLFGHSTTTTTVWAVTHNVYTTSPKCREQTYRIIYCTRSGCNYNTGSIIGDIRVPCCK